MFLGMGIQSGLPDVTALPLFQYVDQASGQEEKPGVKSVIKTQEGVKRNAMGILKSPDEFDLDSTYSDPSRRERGSQVKFLGISTDGGFIIMIDHSYTKNIERHYTSGWYGGNRQGERRIFRESRNIEEQKTYRVYTTWWKGEGKVQIGVYNGKSCRGKESEHISLKGIRPIVTEILKVLEEEGAI